MEAVSEFKLLEAPLDGCNLLEASAGTGKTYNIAALFLRLLLERRLEVGQILVVTFTQAATEELRDRIRRRIAEALAAFEAGESSDPFLQSLIERCAEGEKGRARLTAALAGFDEAAVHTIHGFCQRVLQESAFECGRPFDVELVQDQRPLLEEIAADFYRLRFYGAPPELVRFNREWKLNPSTLSAFAKGARVAGGVTVEGPPPPGDLAPLAQLCRDRFASLRPIWESDGEEVGTLLLESPALSRSKYRKDSVAGWLPFLELYLADGDPYVPFDKFDRFCAGNIAASTKKGGTPPSHRFFEACQTLSDAQDQLAAEMDRLKPAILAEFLEYLRGEFPRRKGERNILHFDDLLLQLRQALEGEGGDLLTRTLRERFPAALVDEFQDTDPVQYAIFSRIYDSPSTVLYMVGDPKQAIYSFRGADIFAYLAAARQARRGFRLETNWRSVPALLEGVNTLFGRHPTPFVFDGISYQGVKPCGPAAGRALLEGEENNHAPLRLWHIPPGDDGKPLNKEDEKQRLCEAVAAEAARLIAGGRTGEVRILSEEGVRNLVAGDIAVLVRENREGQLVRAALARWAIPCVLYQGVSLFGSEEAQEVLRLLCAVATPHDEGKVRGALVTGLLGGTGDDLVRFAGDDQAWEGVLERFRHYHSLWNGRGFITMINTLLSREGVRPRLLALTDGDRRVTNVLHLVEVIHQAGLEQRLGVEGVLKWLGRQIEEVPEKDEYQLRLETDENLLKVVTIHKSKGLEYPVVFAPFTWGGVRKGGDSALYHARPDGDRTVLDLGSEGLDRAKSLAAEEDLAESLRLLYVALTRAKYRCYLAWGCAKGWETSAPGYLIHARQPLPPGGVDALEESLKGLDEEGLMEDLRLLVEESAGSISLEPLPEPVAPYRIGETGTELGDLIPPESGGPVPPSASITSFSALVSGRHLHEEGRGWDEGGGRREPPAVTAGSFLDFPRGGGPGTCLHAIFEEWDFTDRSPERLAALVEEELSRYGIEGEWTSTVCDMVRSVLGAPLGPGEEGPLLESITPRERIVEMEFHFPVERLNAPGLSHVFSRHGGPQTPAECAELFAQLGFAPVQGLVKGFIDLIFRHGERYYLLDWKSNHLGHRAADYAPEALTAAMNENHYTLQYHLYAVALHRYLASRLGDDYSYGKNFGGVYYLFLRGIRPEWPQGSGIYYRRPEEGLIEALSAYFQGEGR